MTKQVKILKIGIASSEAMRARTLKIARGETKPKPDDPKVWFASLESLAQVLSANNRLLLEIIRRSQPTSLKQLAELSGRAEGNLSRTLHTMERYRLVELETVAGKTVPRVPYERVELAVSL